MQTPNNTNLDVLEHVPVHYYRTPGAEAAIEAGDVETAQLIGLRSEIQWSRGEGVPSSLYAVARTIGDFELYSASDEISTILDSSRFMGSPWEYDNVIDSKEGVVKVVGSHDAGHLKVDVESIYGIAADLRGELMSKGIKERTVGDAELAVGLHIGAHESAHALLYGVGRLVKSIDFDRGDPNHVTDERLLATKVYLGQHPEQAISGNWNADVAIHEERFAEGYGQMVAKRALTLLGYSDNEIGVFIDAIAPAAGFAQVEQGKHQIDHIDAVSADRSAATIVKSIDEAAAKRTHQDYEGDLGYSLPLSKEDLVAQLVDTSESIRTRNAHGYASAHPDTTKWHENVGKLQSAETKDLIREMKAERIATLVPRVGKSALRAFIEAETFSDLKKTKGARRELRTLYPEASRKQIRRRIVDTRKRRTSTK